MPRWLWILIGVLLALALIVWLVLHLDVNAKESEALAALFSLAK